MGMVAPALSCARVLLWSTTVVAVLNLASAAGPTNYIDLPRSEEVAVDSAAASMHFSAPPGSNLGGNFRWDEAAVLTDGNKKYAAANCKMMLVAFLAPWCANSQRLEPVLDAVSKSLSAISHEVTVAKVNAPSNPALCAEFGVDGYPQVFWKVRDRITPYRLGLNARSLSSFISMQTQPAATEVVPFFNSTLVQTLQRKAMTNRRMLVGFFERPNVRNRGRDLNAFIQASNDHRHIPSVYVLVEDVKNDRERVAAAFGAKVPGVRLFRRVADGFGTNGTNLRGRVTAAAIREFVKTEAAPSVAVLSAETAKSIFEGATQEHVLFIGDAASPPLAGVVRGAWSEHRERFNYVVVPPGSSRFLLHFGIAATELPLVAVADLRDATQRTLHRYTGEWDPRSVQQFVRDYAEGTPKTGHDVSA